MKMNIIFIIFLTLIILMSSLLYHPLVEGYKSSKISITHYPFSGDGLKEYLVPVYLFLTEQESTLFSNAPMTLHNKCLLLQTVFISLKDVFKIPYNTLVKRFISMEFDDDKYNAWVQFYIKSSIIIAIVKKYPRPPKNISVFEEETLPIMTEYVEILHRLLNMT